MARTRNENDPTNPTMSPRPFLLVPLTLTAGLFAVEQPAPAIERPPVTRQHPAAAQTPTPAGEQRLYAPGSDTLIPRQAAEGIVQNFRNAFAKNGTAPRVVVYVNRALVDTSSGLKLTARSENYERTDTSFKATGTNTYAAGNSTAAAPTLADQQTVREIERLIGRAFRHAGVQLADQKIAATLLPEKAGAHLTGDQAAKDREALIEVADIAVEVLISSRSLTVPQVAGDATYAVPDIQATAIRLKDATIVGQAAASDVIGKGVQAGRVMRQFDVADITEATALALMEDMLTK